VVERIETGEGRRRGEVGLPHAVPVRIVLPQAARGLSQADRRPGRVHAIAGVADVAAVPAAERHFHRTGVWRPDREPQRRIRIRSEQLLRPQPAAMGEKVTFLLRRRPGIVTCKKSEGAHLLLRGGVMDLGRNGPEPGCAGLVDPHAPAEPRVHAFGCERYGTREAGTSILAWNDLHRPLGPLRGEMSRLVPTADQAGVMKQ